MLHAIPKDLGRWFWGMGHKKDTNTYIVASESAALSSMGAKLDRDDTPR